MAFWGCTFSFDGVSSVDHQLMIYDIGSNGQEATKFAHTVNIQEEHVGTGWKPLFLGVTYENKLETTITFGLNQDRIDEQRYLTRDEMRQISSWLAGHEQYKWLEVNQEDMRGIRYRCMITELTMIEYGNLPWGFSAKITCDGPYAYLYPEVYEYTVRGEMTVEIDNKSDHNGYYCPPVTIDIGSSILVDDYYNALIDVNNFVICDGIRLASGESGGTASGTNEFTIENLTTGRTMVLSGYSDGVIHIEVDNEHGVISANSGENMYRHFNFQFLRLKRGKNTLRFRGVGRVIIRCEYPVSVGL